MCPRHSSFRAPQGPSLSLDGAGKCVSQALQASSRPLLAMAHRPRGRARARARRGNRLGMPETREGPSPQAGVGGGVWAQTGRRGAGLRPT